MAAGSRIPAPDHNASDGTSDIPQSTLPGASDPQVEHAQPLAVVLDAVRQPGMPLSRMVATIMDGYADRPAFGERVRELVSDPATGTTAVRLLPRFDTVTYRELWSRVGAVAADWYHHDTAPLRAGDFVGTLGFTSIDYATVDLACVWLGAVCVPLQCGIKVYRSKLQLPPRRVSPIRVPYSHVSADAGSTPYAFGCGPLRISAAKGTNSGR